MGRTKEQRTSLRPQVPALLQDRAQLLNGINDPTALDNLLFPEESVRRCLGEWGGWVVEIAKALHGVNLDHEATTFKVFKVFRVFRLTPGLEWKADEEGSAKARNGESVHRRRCRTRKRSTCSATT